MSDILLLSEPIPPPPIRAPLFVPGTQQVSAEWERFYEAIRKRVEANTNDLIIFTEPDTSIFLTTFNGRAGPQITPQNGDYDFSQISGVLLAEGEPGDVLSLDEDGNWISTSKGPKVEYIIGPATLGAAFTINPSLFCVPTSNGRANVQVFVDGLNVPEQTGIFPAAECFEVGGLNELTIGADVFQNTLASIIVYSFVDYPPILQPDP